MSTFGTIANLLGKPLDSVYLGPCWDIIYTGYQHRTYRSRTGITAELFTGPDGIIHYILYAGRPINEGGRLS